MKTFVDQVRVGQAQLFGPKGEASAYRKRQVTGTLAVGLLGLEGDEQADKKLHGGVDKALLHYAYDHYADWLQELPELAQHFSAPGAFGENISSRGLTEATVCIGDRFRLGTSLVEVSQGRRPCWKLGHHFGTPDIVRDVVRTRRGGWYYRVIGTGQVKAGDAIELLDRPCPEWPVIRVLGLLIGDTPDPGGLSELVHLRWLSNNWRQRAVRKLQAQPSAPKGNSE